jgi:hypothetical protein
MPWFAQTWPRGVTLWRYGRGLGYAAHGNAARVCGRRRLRADALLGRPGAGTVPPLGDAGRGPRRANRPAGVRASHSGSSSRHAGGGTRGAGCSSCGPGCGPDRADRPAGGRAGDPGCGPGRQAGLSVRRRTDAARHASRGARHQVGCSPQRADSAGSRGRAACPRGRERICGRSDVTRPRVDRDDVRQAGSVTPGSFEAAESATERRDSAAGTDVWLDVRRRLAAARSDGCAKRRERRGLASARAPGLPRAAFGSGLGRRALLGRERISSRRGTRRGTPPGSTGIESTAPTQHGSLAAAHRTSFTRAAWLARGRSPSRRRMAPSALSR